MCQNELVFNDIAVLLTEDDLVRLNLLMVKSTVLESGGFHFSITIVLNR